MWLWIAVGAGTLVVVLGVSIWLLIGGNAPPAEVGPSEPIVRAAANGGKADTRGTGKRRAAPKAAKENRADREWAALEKRTAKNQAAPPRSAVPNFAGVIFSPKMKAVAGKRKVLAILWDPHRPGHPAPPRQDVERLLFGPRPSVADWFRENSGGKLTITSAGVLGWYHAARPATHYWSTTKAKDPKDRDGDGWLNGHVEKWAEAIRRAAKEFKFTPYDVNHDGVLATDELAILIVIPQKSPFGTNRRPAGRQTPRWEPLVIQGVRIPVIAEWYTGIPTNQGAPAHELCHLLLGAPDLYVNGPYQFAARDYSIMDHSYTTAHLDPFEKLKLGWLDCTVVSKSGEFTLRDVETHRRVLLLYDPGRGPGEYFLIENRWRRGSYDAGAGAAGSGIGADGLAIWHILEDPALFGKGDPAAGGPAEWGRRGIRLVRANGGNPVNDSRALFNRKWDFLTDETEPARFRWIDGSATGFGLRLLTDAGPEVRVQIIVGRPSHAVSRADGRKK
jgi:M6 family metalloprotease-like protein